MVFNTTFNNISAMSWRSVLLMEETWVPGENHRSAANHWQSHNDIHIEYEHTGKGNILLHKRSNIVRFQKQVTYKESFCNEIIPLDNIKKNDLILDQDFKTFLKFIKI